MRARCLHSSLDLCSLLVYLLVDVLVVVRALPTRVAYKLHASCNTFI